MTKLKSMSDIENEKKSKNKKKENKEMKTIKNNSTLKTIVTVLLTLGVVAAFAATFYQGYLYGASSEKAKTAEVTTQVKNLASAVSKENQ